MRSEPTPLGRAVKMALLDRNMTQKEFASLLGVSPKYLNLILSGKRTGEKYLTKIISILNLDPDDLVGEKLTA